MPPLATDADRPTRLLYFLLAGERLAIDIRWLRGVVVVEEYTLVPAAPSHLLGLANLRGAALPILDAGPALGRPARPAGSRTTVLVIAAGEAQVGVAIDAILGLEPAGTIVPIAEGTPGPHVELGLGLVRRDDTVALLLNPPKFLDALRLNTRWTL